MFAPWVKTWVKLQKKKKSDISKMTHGNSEFQEKLEKKTRTFEYSDIFTYIYAHKNCVREPMV